VVVVVVGFAVVVDADVEEVVGLAVVLAGLEVVVARSS